MVIGFIFGMVVGGCIVAVAMAMLAYCNGKEEIDKEREGY